MGIDRTLACVETLIPVCEAGDIRFAGIYNVKCAKTTPKSANA